MSIGGVRLDAKETIKALLEASEDGTITAEQVTQAGLHRSVLQELVKSGELYRFGRGLYVRSGIWEDELYLLQREYGRGIYSMETALYLHGYSDRAPAQYTMTFPKGYNTPSLKQENVTIKWVQQLNYPLGIIEIPSPCGNPIISFRSLCLAAPDCGLSARFIRTLGIYTKPIFPVRTVEVAGVTILMLGAAVLVPVKSGLALHEHFKCAAFTAHKVHSGCASFLDLGRKKRRRLLSKSAALGYAKRDAALR